MDWVAIRNEDSEPIINRITWSWYQQIGYLFEQAKVIDMFAHISKRRKLVTVYPDIQDVFKALRLTSFEDTKVVILGQDCYHDGNADGLAFSCKNDISPSLKVILKEIDTNIIFPEVNKSINYLTCEGNLEHLAEQGVLLLNTRLTVERGIPLSHSNSKNKVYCWEYVVGEILRAIITRKIQVVFMIWGSEAKKLVQSIIGTNRYPATHLFLECGHPMTEVYPNATSDFYGKYHFNKTNEYLINNQLKPINW